MTPADCYLFLKTAISTERTAICEVTDIINNAAEQLKRVSQNCFQKYFRPIYNRWQKCTRGLF